MHNNSTGIELNWPGRQQQIKLTALPQVALPLRLFPAVGNTDEMSVPQLDPNLLLQGDNGPGLRQLLATERGKVQLIYLDPPFATGRKFHQPAGNRKQGEKGAVAYRDSWQHSEGAYLNLLEERLLLCRELLARSGSLYLHLDYRMAPIARLLLDEIFGEGCFVNEIIWYYRTGGMPEKLGFGRKHDTLLFYVKDPTRACWRRQQEKSYLSHKYGFGNIELHEDEQGFYTMANMRDVWDIPALRGNQPERVAYPTQKPLELLKRIIMASTDPGDLVLDPFAGSGTTLVAAEKLERRWIGLDSSPLAISVIQDRMTGLQQRNAFEVLSLAKVERQLWTRDVTDDQEQSFRAQLMDHCVVKPVDNKLYHACRDESALFVDGLRETFTVACCRKLLIACERDGFRRLELLLTDSDSSQREKWHREAERRNISLTIKQIPRELISGKKADRKRLPLEEIPRLIKKVRTRKGKRCLELTELQFNDPSPGQLQLLNRFGWHGLVNNWWVVGRDGTLLWQSGGGEIEPGNGPLLSGPMPAGEKLHLEVRDRQGLVW
jgi:DNA modification methylase